MEAGPRAAAEAAVRRRRLGELTAPEVHAAAATGFHRAAEEYERARPGYPLEVVDLLPAARDSTVVDIGAGTGKLTRRLTAAFDHVVAVEPVAGMRTVLAREVPKARIVAAAAEALPVRTGSAALVTVAQAIHWIANPRALAEVRRVLASHGSLAVVQNVRDRSDPIHSLLSELREAKADGAPSYATGEWLDVLQACGLGLVESSLIPNDLRLTRDEVLDQCRSMAPIAALDDSARDEVLARVRALTDRREEPIELRYRTEVHVWRVR